MKSQFQQYVQFLTAVLLVNWLRISLDVNQFLGFISIGASLNT